MFIDIDEWNPQHGLFGFFGHFFFEVLDPAVTDPMKIGQLLGGRGVDLGHNCKLLPGAF
jgi:hypothetical protein